MKRFFIWIFVVVFFVRLCPHAFSQATISQLLSNGPTATRLNIVFLSEGYTSAQLNQFTNDAAVVLNKFLITPPYDEYKSYFNAFAISVASLESGSDHPAQSIYKNTYFNSSYDTYGSSFLLTIPPNDRDPYYANGRDKVDALLQSLMPEYDLPILIVNDAAYGGSGGFPSISSINSSSAEISIHEISHTFAALGDEYATAYPGYPDTEEPNTTQQTNRAQIKWNAWISPATTIPTPTTSNTVIGLFEGAHYHTTNWYRPKFNCKMRTLGIAFCSVCAETLVKSIYERIRPIDSFSPATSTTVFITNGNTLSLSINLLKPTTHNLNVQWFTNNVAVSGATSTVFSVNGFFLSQGINQIRVQATDSTTFVRNDPSGLLNETKSWNVTTVIEPPRLKARFEANKVVLTWPTNSTGFTLEETTGFDFPTTIWQPVTNSITVISNENSVTLSPSGMQKFFRMKK